MIKFTIFFLLIFNVSYAVEFSGDFKQGSFILGKTDPNSKVFQRKDFSHSRHEFCLIVQKR